MKTLTNLQRLMIRSCMLSMLVVWIVGKTWGATATVTADFTGSTYSCSDGTFAADNGSATFNGGIPAGAVISNISVLVNLGSAQLFSGSASFAFSLNTVAIGNITGISAACTTGSFTASTVSSYNNTGNNTLSFTSSNTGITLGKGVYLATLTITYTVPSTPTITVSTGSLNFSNTCVGSNSSQQSYNVSGSNLTANIIITPTVGFQISTTSGSGFVSNPNTITLTQTGGSVPSTPIYTRFSPTLAQAYSGNITHTSTGATQQNVAVSGTGVALPTCNISGNDAVCAGTTGNSYSGPSSMSSYAWSITAGTGTIVGASNTQTVSVTAGTGASFTLSLTTNDGTCSNTCEKIVTINALPTFSRQITKAISCNGATDGEVTITVITGQAPFKYRYKVNGTSTWLGDGQDEYGWIPFDDEEADEQVIGGLGDGIYHIEIKDDYGCEQIYCTGP